MIEVPPPRVNLTCITGSPLCGKTTIRKTHSKAGLYVTGFLSFDMSDDVIAWHENPTNGSPFREAFVAQEVDRQAGNLMTDELINNALYYYLNEQIISHGDVRHITLSGFPRKWKQIAALREMDPHARVAFIEATLAEAEANRVRRIASGSDRPDDQPEPFARRWKRYGQVGGTREELLTFGNKHPDQFVHVKFRWPLIKKATIIARRLHATPAECASIVNQINCEGSAAWNYVNEIEPVPKKAGPVHQESVTLVPENQPAFTHPPTAFQLGTMAGHFAQPA